jgi:hypothetical protein
MCHPTTISKYIYGRNDFQLLFNYFEKIIGEGKKPKTTGSIINKKF